MKRGSLLTRRDCFVAQKQLLAMMVFLNFDIAEL